MLVSLEDNISILVPLADDAASILRRSVPEISEDVIVNFTPDARVISQSFEGSVSIAALIFVSSVRV